MQLSKYNKIAFFLIIALLSIFWSRPLKAQGPNQDEKIFLYSKPAVVRLGMFFTGNVTFPSIELVQQEDGKLGVQWVGGTTSVDMETGFSCSGFIINPSGYILTNAHCADTSSDNISSLVWDQFSYELYDNLQSNLPPQAVPSDQIAIADLHKQILNFIVDYGEIKNLTWWFSVFDPNRSEGSVQDFISKGFQPEIKKMGQPYPQPGKDIAIIKIDKENAPIVKLGDSNDTKTGGRIFVMGFPATADLNESGYIEPSFTSGIVSAIKKSSQGDYNVIQIDAAIAGGNSGGPVFNEKGEVIGIATFGSSETQGYNWILPINLAKDFLNELNVATNTNNITNQHYQLGIDYFLDKKYSKAKEEFQKVQALYPAQTVAQLINKSDVAIIKGEETKEESQKNTKNYLLNIMDFFKNHLWIVILITIILLIIIVIIILFIKRKKKSFPSASVNQISNPNNIDNETKHQPPS